MVIVEWIVPILLFPLIILDLSLISVLQRLLRLLNLLLEGFIFVASISSHSRLRRDLGRGLSLLHVVQVQPQGRLDRVVEIIYILLYSGHLFLVLRCGSLWRWFGSWREQRLFGFDYGFWFALLLLDGLFTRFRWRGPSSHRLEGPPWRSIHGLFGGIGSRPLDFRPDLVSVFSFPLLEYTLLGVAILLVARPRVIWLKSILLGRLLVHVGKWNRFGIPKHLIYELFIFLVVFLQMMLLFQRKLGYFLLPLVFSFWYRPALRVIAAKTLFGSCLRRWRFFRWFWPTRCRTVLSLLRIKVVIRSIDKADVRELALYIVFYYATDLPKIKISWINREVALADARIIAKGNLEVAHLIKWVWPRDEGLFQILLVVEVPPFNFVVEVPTKLLELPQFDLQVFFELDFWFTMIYLCKPIKQRSIYKFLELK